MPVVNTYDGNVPTYDADEDVWGFELNTALGGQIKPTLDAFATAINANETAASGALAAANGALPKAGGTATGPINLAPTSGGGLYEAGFRGLPVVNFDANITLSADMNGTMRRLNGTTARSVTIPTNAAVPLPVGFTVDLRAYSSQAITVARSGAVELRLAGSTINANATVASFGEGTLTQEDTNIWVIRGPGVS